MIVAGVACLAELAPDRVMSICYESLVADPAGELRRLAAFIGVEAAPGWLATAGALVRPQPARWTQLPEPERRRLVDACAPGMRLLSGDADA
jgi:putative sulfotransferase